MVSTMVSLAMVTVLAAPLQPAPRKHNGHKSLDRMERIVGAWYYKVGSEGVKDVFKPDGSFAWYYGQGPAKSLGLMATGKYTFDGAKLTIFVTRSARKGRNRPEPKYAPDIRNVVFRHGEAVVTSPAHPLGKYNPLHWRRVAN